MISLRDYQQTGVDNLRGSYRGGKRAPLFVLGTGGGKTVLFTYVAANSSQRGKRALILVHRVELLRQTSRALERMGVPHGLISPGCTPTGDAVQVASVGTLARRMSKMKWQPDIIIIDEAHHGLAGTWMQIIANYPNALLLGVTATPCRLDGRGLGDVFDDLILGPSVAEMIKRGFLSPYVVYAPPEVADLSGIHSRAGDFAINEVAARMDKPTVTGDAVSHYKRICPGQPAIAFCANIDHAEHTALAFREAGFRAINIDGKTDSDIRARAIADLGSGKLDVLTNCGIISEGTDVPVVSTAIMLRPTDSLSLYLQMVGRVLRPIYAPGSDITTDTGRVQAIAAGSKPAAIILDHVGNVARHGFPDDEREWRLDMTVKRKKSGDEPPPIRQCPRCYFAHRPAPICPGCGFVYMPKSREVIHVDGELVALDPEKMRKVQKQEVGKARTLEDLQAIERARGYKPGWSEHVWRARQGRKQTA